MKKSIKIGTRDSLLAIKQAELAGEQTEKLIVNLFFCQ